MIIKSFKELKKYEWIIYITSLGVVALSNIIAKDIYLPTLFATLLGVTALIFVAKGNVLGQILTVIFSILYSITSYKFKYYGEMITYLGMSMPIAALSVYTWIKNPYEEGKNVVKIHRLTKRQKKIMIVLAIIVTSLFYFILKLLGTTNLFVSTISVTTSFLAVYLLALRNSYYAIAYGANDVVLIILWILASIEDLSYLPMVFCFLMFLINDIYGFISWKIREKKQGLVWSLLLQIKNMVYILLFLLLGKNKRINRLNNHLSCLQYNL